MKVIDSLTNNSTGHRCIVITVGNHKGGCGKTTLSYALAVNAFEQGKRVLLVDMDQQGTLGKLFNIDGNDYKYSNYTLSKMYNRCSNVKSHIIASTPLLLCESEDLTSNASVSIILGDHNLKDVVENTEEIRGQAETAECFKRIIDSYRRYFDLIIFDTTPVIEKVKSCIHALAVSDCIVMPVDALKAVDEIDQTMQAVTKFNQKEPNVLIVCTKYRKEPLYFSKMFDDQCRKNNLPVCIKYVKSKHVPRVAGHDERRNTYYRLLFKIFPDNMCKVGIPDQTDIEVNSYTGANKENREIIDDVCKEILLKACSGAKGEIENLCNEKVWSSKRELLNKYLGIIHEYNVKNMCIKKDPVAFKTPDKLSVVFDTEAVNRRVALEREAHRDR